MRVFIMATMIVILSLVDSIASNDFGRYQAILDRKPFGDDPIPQPPQEIIEQPSGPALPPFTQNLKLVAMIDDDFGIRVGFVDIQKKPAKNYFLYVGEKEDDITVLKADYDKKEVLLEKEGVQSWLHMNTMAGGAPKPAPGASGFVARSGPVIPAASSVRMSYRNRLKERSLARTRVVKGPELTGEALRKEYERVQMDLIRKGQPPLPIPLTQEMDDQLVAEGVLPPVE